MGYYESALKALPFTSYKLNTAETGYVDIGGRAGTFTGSAVFAPSILAGASKSLSVTGGTTYDITTSVFRKGQEGAAFSLVAWFAPLTFQVGQLSILSHTGAYDGLMFDGDNIKFRIKSSLNNYLETSWPVPDLPEAYMVAGVYTTQKIQLFINGVVVSEAEVTDEFKTWAQESSSNLFLGQSVTAYKATADGLTTYAFALTTDQIVDMFLQGRDVISTFDAVNAFGGSYWTGTQRSIALQRVWNDEDTWSNAVLTNVSATDGYLKPQNDYSTGLSMAGTWQTSLELNATELTSIGGVDLEWDGDGSFIVQTSVDGGTNWINATNGRNVAGTFNYNTTNKIMDIRITFTGGIANDISVVRRLRATVFGDAVILGDDTSRSLTVTDNVSTPIDFNEPIERNTSTGIDFYNGSITVSADATSTPRNVAAIEFWARPRSAAVSGTGGYFFDNRPAGGTTYLWIQASNNFLGFANATVYVNGVSITSGTYAPRYNEWMHVVIVPTTSFNTYFTVGAGFFDGQVAQISVYPAALTAAQVLALYQAYGKVPLGRIDDAGLITVVEPATPLNAYAYVWDTATA